MEADRRPRVFYIVVGFRWCAVFPLSSASPAGGEPGASVTAGWVLNQTLLLDVDDFHFCNRLGHAHKHEDQVLPEPPKSSLTRATTPPQAQAARGVVGAYEATQSHTHSHIASSVQGKLPV